MKMPMEKQAITNSMARGRTSLITDMAYVLTITAKDNMNKQKIILNGIKYWIKLYPFSMRRVVQVNRVNAMILNIARITQGTSSSSYRSRR
jgi:hypothetical protein